MRGSCSDDLERRGIPEKAINAWIGNTARLRSKHYHAVRTEDWAAVTGVTENPAPIPAPSAAISGDQEPSTLHEAREKSLDVQKTLENQYPRQGENKPGFTREKRKGRGSPGTQSGTRPASGRRSRKGGAR